MSPLVVTVTPNASLDLTYRLADGDRLDREDVEVHRAVGVILEASGKGVNVTRTLARAGVRSIAVLPVGGATGAQLQDLLAAEGIEHVAVPVDGDTRVNTTALEPLGRTVKLNGPGPALAPQQAQALLAAATQALALAGSGPDDEPAWLVVSGSLPPGAGPDLIARLVEVARAGGARCAVDTSGPALALALEAGADLLAPNASELAAISPEVAAVLTGPDPHGAALLAAVGRTAAVHGCELLVSLGADGAVWTDGLLALRARAEAAVPVNTAGAGDALLAGWLVGDGSARDRLGRAVSWGRAACLAPTTVAEAAVLTSPRASPPIEFQEVRVSGGPAQEVIQGAAAS